MNDSCIDWTPKLVATLRKHWDDGLSAAEIGRALGVSKNAVVGKVHRLKFPSRPSPIKPGAGPRLPKLPGRARAPKVTLPPLPASAPVVIGLPRAIVRSAPTPPLPKAPPAELTTRVAGGEGCRYITGGNSRAPITCDAPRIVVRRASGQFHASSYCRAHHERCYVHTIVAEAA